MIDPVDLQALLARLEAHSREQESVLEELGKKLGPIAIHQQRIVDGQTEILAVIRSLPTEWTELRATVSGLDEREKFSEQQISELKERVDSIKSSIRELREGDARQTGAHAAITEHETALRQTYQFRLGILQFIFGIVALLVGYLLHR